MKATQAVIIILLLANLGATIWFGTDNDIVPAQNQFEKAAQHELPPIITKSVRKKIYQDFAVSFNSANYDGLYNLFGSGAKAQFSKDEAYSEFRKLNKYFHSVEDGAYTHSELAGAQGNTNYYMLYYAVKLSEKSEFGTKGTLKITIAVQGSDYQIYGIRLNAGN